MNTDHRIHDPRLQRLMKALPHSTRRSCAWLIRPEAKWLRLPLSVVLIVGGCFGFLPVLGFWMLPIGALLLGEDIPPVRRVVLSLLGKVQHCWDGWHQRKFRGTT